jgi:hypothetical protein
VVLENEMSLDGKETARLADAAERALKSTFEMLTTYALDRAGRARTIDESFLSSVKQEERDASILDVKQGDGGELAQPKDRSLYPRFHSARSSCALAVNAFAPWRLDPLSLRILGISGFTSLRFECRCPIKGVPDCRTPPNLDLIAEGGTVVGLESKLIEHIKVGTIAEFSPDYDLAISTLADDRWKCAIARLKESRNHFQAFAAGQIAKHYLGMKTIYGSRVRSVLVYLYWEPPNEEQHRFFRVHRDEVSEFSTWVSGGDIEFRHLSYPQLIDEWNVLKEPDWLPEHILRLRERFVIDVVSA